MRLKDLMVIISNNDTSDKRLDVAIALAEKLEAHLSALLLVPEPFNPTVAGVPLPVQLIEQQRQQIEAEAKATIEHVTQKGNNSNINLEIRQETGYYEQWPSLLARQARHADLCIIGQANSNDDSDYEADMLIEAAFMQTGRPSLIIPYIGARQLPPERVIVCWDGSREASRALHDSLPLIEGAKETTLLIVDPESLSTSVGALPGADIGAHLARHGINVDIKTIVSGRLSVGETILSEITNEGADLVVMGGYGHSRLREMVLGGATRELLKSMTVPVLMSH